MFKRLRFYLTATLLGSALLQIVFFYDPMNALCSLIAAAGSIIVVQSMLRPGVVQRFPLSSIGIFMYAIVNLIIPLVVSNLELRALNRNLDVPLETFGYLTLGAITLVLTHKLYAHSRRTQRFRQFITKNVNERFGMFSEPNDAQLWLVGFIGLGCMFYIARSMTDSRSAFTWSATQRLISAFSPFTYAPFLTALRFLFSPKRSPLSGRKLWALSAYFVLVVIAALMRNDRSDFAMPVAVLLFSIVLGILTYRLVMERATKRVLIPLTIGGLIAYPLLATLAISMVYVRTVYSRESARTQIGLVLDMMGRTDDLEQYLEDKALTSNLWDEHYYNPGNVFLARFANVKYHDNGFYLAEMTDDERDMLRDFTWGNLVSILPGPLLSAVGYDIKKNEYLSMSTGDYMFWLRYGKGLGGQRTGSAIAQGLAIFGLANFFVWGAVMWLFFTVVDSFSRRFRVKGAYRRVVREGRPYLQRVISTPQFAPIILLNIFVVLDPYRSGSYTDTPFFLIRGLPQQLVIYGALMFITGQVTKLFSVKRTDRRRIGARRTAMAMESTQG